MSDLAEILRLVSCLPDFLGVEAMSVNVRGINEDTPMHAVVHWHRPDFVEVLLQAGADPNAVGEMGKTPIFYAIAEGDWETIKRLLDWGARVDVSDEFGYTPQELAKERGIDLAALAKS